MATLIISCFVVAVLLHFVRKQMGNPARLPTIQAMLYFLAMGAQHDPEGIERATGLVDALKRSRDEAERRKAEELLRTVIAQGPPGQVFPALAAAWALQFSDFEELLAAAVQRECLTREAWENNLEVLEEEFPGRP